MASNTLLEGPCCSSSLLKEFRLEADAINVLLDGAGFFLIDDEVFLYKKRGCRRELG